MTNTHKREKKYIQGLLKKDDKDGYYFVDYLRASFSEFECRSDYFSFMKKHKEMIENNIEQFKNCSKIKDKYEWLMNYHNNTIDKFFGEREEIEDIEEDNIYCKQDFIVKSTL